MRNSVRYVIGFGSKIIWKVGIRIRKKSKIRIQKTVVPIDSRQCSLVMSGWPHPREVILWPSGDGFFVQILRGVGTIVWRKCHCWTMVFAQKKQIFCRGAVRVSWFPRDYIKNLVKTREIPPNYINNFKKEGVGKVYNVPYGGYCTYTGTVQ